MEANIELYLLGPVLVKNNGKPVVGFESRKALALLCYLAEQNQPVSRDELTQIFWGNKSTERGRSNLSRVLHNNTRLLPGCLVITRETVQFAPSVTTFVDVNFFRELIMRKGIAALLEAVALPHGDFMEDMVIANCAEFDNWLTTEQEMWRQQIAMGLSTLIAHYRNSGDYEQGLEFALRLLRLDPWREEAHREVMMMLALSGQRTAALAQYEKCCRILNTELGVAPSAETTALYYRIRAGEAGHRNNNVYRPSQPIESITPNYTKLQPVAAATGITAGGPPDLYLRPNKTNVPTAYPVLNGKPTEFDLILERLANPACRMLTLVGPNNDIQKRLLFQVMTSSAQAFRDGICFVTNHSNSRVSLLIDIARSLDLAAEETENDPLWDEEGKANIWLFKHLRDKEMLLVFNYSERYNNFVFLFEAIAKRAPMLKILINAQTPLNLNSEWVFDIY